jgi:hypothetical protein
MMSGPYDSSRINQQTPEQLTGENIPLNLHVRPKAAALLVIALLTMSTALNYAHARKASAVEYTYKVHNKSASTITALLASEDGKTYGQFDIGKGIAPGKIVTLVWDKSTDEGNCEQWVKAKFADGGVSPAAKFDFCEEDLVLEFE